MKQTMKRKTNRSFKSLAAFAFALPIAFLGTSALQADDKDHKHEEHADDHKHEKKGDDDHDHEEHAHDHDIVGPNGGRVLHEVDPHLEFFVTDDRKVQITAVDGEGKAISLEKQTVRVTGGSRTNPTRMTFEKKGDSLISTVAFPKGNNFPVVVQIKPKPDAKTVMEKFNLNLDDCPTCDYLEYACVCDHGDEEEEGHDHKHDDHKEHDHKDEKK